MHRPLLAWGVLAYLYCFSACSSAFAQANKKPTDSVSHAVDTQDKKTLKGCLTGSRGHFYLASVDGGQLYALTGNTSALSRYAGKEISVLGEAVVSTQQWPSFQVVSVKQVFDTPKPSLSPSFSDLSAWHGETNQTYGIKFALPPEFTDASGSESSMLQASFASNQDVATVSRWRIPQEVYPHTNFLWGSFAIFVNPEIRNAQSCREFNNSDPRFRSVYRVGGILYARMRFVGAAMGTTYVGESFHTFQNGLCYEIGFEFAESNTGNYDLGCTIPVIRNEDELKLVEPLVAAVSFVRPAIEVARESNPNAVPRVTKFEASSERADDVVNRGKIMFTWATKGADYVELSYRCAPAPTGPGVVILEDGSPRECENSSPRIYPNGSPNRAPNAFQNVGFGNFHQGNPVSITVSVTPFSHGTPYPDSRKSITIQVDPYNPFPEGVPAANGNILLTYPPGADGKPNYLQRSSLTIGWKDARSHDPCVDLYLIQDDATGAANYRLQIADSCLSPSHSGSYTWTIPDKYAGAGYRILAITPGGTSSGLGPPFAISPARATR